MELMQPVFDVERRFSRTAAFHWMCTHWKQCFYISAVYVLVVHYIQRKMKERTQFGLRKPLFLWNLTLALFSAVAFYRVGAHFVQEVMRSGWHKTSCSLEWLNGPPGLWSFLFGFAKLPELIDTLFVVLRKQKLMFLHWYHHITVFCYCWYAYVYPHGQGRIFIVMNLFVHSIMYTYYAVRAQGIVKIPRTVNICITTVQLMQMVFGVATFVDAYWMLQNDLPCNVAYHNIIFGILMYFSYAILFAHFFYVNYLKKKSILIEESKVEVSEKKKVD
ncbi:elongation of very long chain fatty acids protein 6-like [Corticium candelabrum]|uniref:elongation of very long chain fatty acids protein 6-like n=1 Tax=Corticium candelabrum TaxID=121492 RepID=UPI002E26BDA5|nr:elongation of very long chain fatty acids protein 6-like [Corticium candelabrum]